MPHPLDNPLWHALTGAHAGMAIGTGLARQYPRDIAPFAAFDVQSEAAYADVARDLPAGLDAWLLRPRYEAGPFTWQTLLLRAVVQMVGDRIVDDPVAPVEQRIRPLGGDHAAAMLALAQATRPGPFALNTHKFGHYIGIFEGDRLIAMAGERLRVPGFVEVSAVAVYPEFRGQGFAAAMIRHMCRRITAQGATPFLHAFPDNPAVALYGRLGFRLRRHLWLHLRRPPARA
ncbi:GNAT family N-acetyltransferase [Xanthobacteraceae bacterium Astr-EGSB]|uniref:GNAT family N-acetyltransferase n=1 Tax=Astrobacterium formosum TaxID=3069710 RepID=UPI0027B35036|nr:GNAT family N-acetyltransferase [Xanthobacteraceae bacterium Astr-EGSB]